MCVVGGRGNNQIASHSILHDSYLCSAVVSGSIDRNVFMLGRVDWTTACNSGLSLCTLGTSVPTKVATVTAGTRSEESRARSEEGEEEGEEEEDGGDDDDKIEVGEEGMMQEGVTTAVFGSTLLVRMVGVRGIESKSLSSRSAVSGT